MVKKGRYVMNRYLICLILLITTLTVLAKPPFLLEEESIFYNNLLFNIKDENIPLRTGVREEYFVNENPDYFLILVESELLETLRDSLTTYIEDLNNENTNVVLLEFVSGNATNLKNLLRQEYNNGMFGAVFVGEFPVAWFKFQDYGDAFPSDYYFMDLDGIWRDEDSDSVFDKIDNYNGFEIFISRLDASKLTGSMYGEIELMENYFDKLHSYRSGNFGYNEKALIYADDDFSGDRLGFSLPMSFLFPDIMSVYDPETTSGDDYRERLKQHYDFIQLLAHSSYMAHYFIASSGNNIFRGTEIPKIDPDTIFYNIFGCSALKFTEENCIGNWYVFSPSSGLLSIGSTKVGSMFLSQNFYRCLDEGLSVGEAFKQWSNIYEQTQPIWFRGLVILGDPMLKVLNSLAFDRVEIVNQNQDSTIRPGDKLYLDIYLKNYSTQTMRNVTVNLYSESGQLTILENTAHYGDIQAGESKKGNKKFVVELSDSLSPGSYIVFNLIINEENEQFIDNFYIQVQGPKLIIENYELLYGFFGRNETVIFNLTLKNIGDLDFEGKVNLVSFNNDFTTQSRNVSCSVPIGETSEVGPFEIKISEFIPIPTTLEVGLSFTWEYDSSYTDTQNFLVGIPNGYIWKCDFEEPIYFNTYAVTEGWLNMWHRNSQRSHSGNYSFKCGGEGITYYQSGIDSVLELPPVKIVDSTKLTFWQYIDIEQDWDGAVVEIYNNDHWEILTPESGYNATLSFGTPLPPGTECFSGHLDWHKVTFDLSNYANSIVKIRFRMVTDGGSVREGWYVDDIEFLADNQNTISPTIELSLNKKHFYPLDDFRLTAKLKNAPFEIFTWLYIVLDIGEGFRFRYYSYPDWQPVVLPYPITLTPNLNEEIEILNFKMPAQLSDFGPIYFYAAFVDPSSVELISPISTVSFYLNSN